MRKIFLSFFFFVCYSTSFSQIRTQQLDSLFRVLDKHSLALGSVTILKDGKTVYQNTTGLFFISSAEKIHTTAQTRYRIGSVSKVFTAVMIIQLIEEKKLTLDQKLSIYFPDLPNAGKITTSHLLNHQSGLHDYTNGTVFEGWMSKPKTQAELLQIIRDKGADFEPGTQHEYCNTNYLLLSYIIEKATGKTYEANVNTRIISKIKLTSTYMAKAINPKNNEATSYKYGNGTWNPVIETNPDIHRGAGAIVSNSNDLASFIYVLFSNKLIKKSSLEKMTTITDGYGMGLFPYDHGTVKGYGHNGRIEEFYTATRHYPEQGITIVYCTNGINFPRTDILEAIIKSCFNERIEIPFASSVPPDLTLYPGTYEAQGMPVVTISVQSSKLVAETQGARFELEPVMKNYFMHAPTGYYFEFVPSESALRIKETDNVYFLKKK